jgi:small conductance mechanosensitive channel
MKRIMLALSFFFLVILSLPNSLVFAEETAESKKASPVTTANPAIPVEELELLLKPLTKKQLLIEADAWQAIVQKKAEQISKAEIMVKRLNEEIENKDQKAKIDRNAEALEDKEKLSESIEAPLKKTKEEIEEKKVKILEEVAKLRKDRTVLLDQLKAVIAALETKTDKNDTGTLSNIQDYTLYASAVSGIQVDIKDATSTWLVIKTWLLSDEGGYRWGLNLWSFIGILLTRRLNI